MKKIRVLFLEESRIMICDAVKAATRARLRNVHHANNGRKSPPHRNKY